VTVVSKVAIAPPPSLMDLDIPPPEGFLEKEREREAAAAAAAAASKLSLLGYVVKSCIAVNGTPYPSHSCRVSLAIWDHTVLPATRHKRTHPAFTPATGWYSIY